MDNIVEPAARDFPGEWVMLWYSEDIIPHWCLAVNILVKAH